MHAKERRSRRNSFSSMAGQHPETGLPPMLQRRLLRNRERVDQAMPRISPSKSGATASRVLPRHRQVRAEREKLFLACEVVRHPLQVRTTDNQDEMETAAIEQLHRLRA
jgi:hypothetical protein